jgi:hypothetical protein
MGGFKRRHGDTEWLPLVRRGDIFFSSSSHQNRRAIVSRTQEQWGFEDQILWGLDQKLAAEMQWNRDLSSF